jgi:phage terminase small subunit
VRGRKPKPTRLKLIEGNPGKRATNQHEPRPEPKVPTCPAHLCPAAKAEWKRLAQELFVLGICQRRLDAPRFCRSKIPQARSIGDQPVW